MQDGPGGRPGDAEGTELPEASPGAAAGRESPRRVLARLYEDDQRADGRTRWSVGATPRVCCACGVPFARGATIHSTLTAAPAGDEERAAEAATLFERRDYCDVCAPGERRSETLPDDVFAYWRSTVDAPPPAPRKKVNLAALFAYFEHLVGTGGHDEEAEEGTGRRAPTETTRPPDLSPGETGRLAYLLGLFLVRRRMLRWVGSAGRTIVLARPSEGRRWEVLVPIAPPEELERSLESFEELFS